MYYKPRLYITETYNVLSLKFIRGWRVSAKVLNCNFYRLAIYTKVLNCNFAQVYIEPRAGRVYFPHVYYNMARPRVSRTFFSLI